MSSEQRPIDHLRRTVEMLVRERDAAQKAFDSGQADVERKGTVLDEAKKHLALVERSHASRLAESHASKEPEVQAALSEATTALEGAQRSMWTAQADRDQATRALEILRRELAESRVRLSEEATRAKQAAAAELIEQAKVAWVAVKTVVDEVEATRLVEHGQDPPEVTRITEGARRFEHDVLEGKPPKPPPAPAKTKGRGKAKPAPKAKRKPAGPVDRTLVVRRGAVTIAGAAGVVVGSVLEWLTPFAASAFDVPATALYRSGAIESTESGQISAGAVMVALAVISLVGIRPRLRLLTPLAGLLAAVGVVGYMAVVADSGGVSFPTDVGAGAWLTLAGTLVLVGAGLLPVRKKAPEAEEAAAEEAAESKEPPTEEGAKHEAAPAVAPEPAPEQAPEPQADAEEAAEPEAKRATVAWLIAAAAILLLVAAVAARNSQSVSFEGLLWTESIPLVWAVPLLVAIGAVIGYAVTHPRGVLRSRPGQERSRGRTAAAILLGVSVALLLVIAFQNPQEVEVDILFTTISLALTGVILVSLVLGFLLGAVIAKRRSRDLRLV